MKLVIQIPCFNEEKTITKSLHDLPQKIPGMDRIETLVIDDGSRDRTVEMAKKAGAMHILSFQKNQGLARAFEAGIERALELGADIVVNFDADNQYKGVDIPRLIKPILEGEADIVVGSRILDKESPIPPIKRIINRAGSAFIRWLSRSHVDDVVSGFRAFSREAALRINVLSEFSYTLENLLQLGNQKLNILSIPIKTNKTLRKSRLYSNVFSFLSSQAATIFRIYTTYKPLRVFSSLGLIVLLPGIIGFFRFMYFYMRGDGQGHIQSLIFSAVFLIVGFLIFLFGIIADIVNNNRKLIEKTLYKVKKLELDHPKKHED